MTTASVHPGDGAAAPDLTFTALCHLASWSAGRQIQGGWAFGDELRQSGILDFSFASLDRIDAFLDQLRIQKKPVFEQAMAEPGYVNLVHLLAFYVGELISRANGVPVDWSLLEQARLPDPFSPAAEQDASPTLLLTCLVRFRADDEPQPFWPLFAIFSRLFEDGEDKSIRLSASFVMALPADETAAGRPLAPLPPVPRGLHAAARFAYSGLSDEERKALFITPLGWMASDPIQKLIDAEMDLLASGFVTWGAIVQANGLLFQQSWHRGAMGEVLYDPANRTPMDDLAAVASAVYALKAGTPSNAEEQVVAEHLRSEVNRAFGLLIPASICTHPLRLSSTFFEQMHLPDGSLAMRQIPLLIHPKWPGVVKPLPATLWPRVVAEEWMDSSYQRFGRRVSAARAKALEEAARPDPEMAFQLAMRLYKSAQDADGPRRALELLEMTATRFGHTQSMLWAGHLHQRGQGTAHNPRQAFQWYLAAAQREHVEAMCLVAEDHMRPTGVEPNLVKAEQWLRQAASLGHAPARRLLVECGFDPDPAQAGAGFLSAVRNRWRRRS